MNDLIKSFLNFKENNTNNSDKTIISYTTDLIQFEKHLLEFRNKTITKETARHIDIMDIDDFFSDLNKKEMKSSTRNRKSMTISLFFKYLMRVGIITNNPAEKMAKIKIDIEEKKHLSKEDFKIFLDAFKNKRDKLIMFVLVNTGLRISELLNLTIGDMKNMKVSIIGKRDKKRKIFINDNCMEVLKDYIKKEKVGSTDSDFLFTNLNNKKLSQAYIWKVINNVCEKIGMTDISAHNLRHTFATLQYEFGADLKQIQMMLGHSDITTTAKIYTHFTETNLEKSFNNNFLEVKYD